MKARHFILCVVSAVAIWAILLLAVDYGRYERAYKNYPQNYSTIAEFPEKIPEMIRQNYELGDYDILERLIPYSPDVEIVYDGIIAKGPVRKWVTRNFSKKCKRYLDRAEKAVYH